MQSSLRYILVTITLAFLLPTLFFVQVVGQILPSSSDISYLFAKESSIYLRHQLVTSDDKHWILLEVSNVTTPFDSLLFTFVFTNNLDKPVDSFLEIKLDNYRIYELEKKQVFAIDISEVDENYIVFKVLKKNSTNVYSYIIELTNPGQLIISTTKLTLPNLSGYVHVGTPLKITTLNGASNNFGVSFYAKKFKPAMPPMANLNRPNPFDSADTTFTTTNNDMVQTSQIGTYAIFKEGFEQSTTFLRVEQQRYPKVVTIDQIIEASIYLLTKEENDKLNSSLNPKKEFDNFWLGNTKSAERAGKMISEYFRRVKIANEKFTTFKEGWKTDMGMIYIIFGPPDKAFRTNLGMQWIYKKSYELPSISFNFYKPREFFASEHYVLERNEKYKIPWFRAIELWRKGRKSL